MANEDFFSRKLKDLDVFKRLPKEVSKGSLFGVLRKFSEKSSIQSPPVLELNPSP